MRTRTLALVLAVSVGLNLFFLGVFAARAWQRAEWRAARQAHGRAGWGPGGDGKRAEPFRWLSDAERAELRPRRKALRSLRREAEGILRAESFDSARFRSTLDALRRETDAIQASVHELMIRRAESLNVEQRRRLADANWGRHGRRGKRGEPGDDRRRGPRRPGNPRADEK